MEHIINTFETAFEAHGNSLAAMLIPKGRQAERFQSLTNHIKEDGFSVLDFGCGLAHLKRFLDDRFTDYHYQGVDLVPAFVDENRSQYKKGIFTQITTEKDIIEASDFTIICGTFNLKYDPELVIHRQRIFEILTHLFQHTNVALSVNFLSDQADFQHEDAWHQPVTEIYQWAIENLTKRITIDHSYMPFEYSLTLFKDDNFCKPENVYRPQPFG